MTAPRRWWRARPGVRVASALSAAAVVAVALVVAGIALVLLVGNSLHAAVATEARDRAARVAERIEQNFRNGVNENAREAVSVLASQQDDLVQVVVDYEPETGPDVPDGAEDVIEAGTEPVGREQAMSPLRPEPGQVVETDPAQVGTGSGGAVESVLVARGASSLGTPVVVLVAAPLTGIARATDTLRFYLLIGVPLLIVVAGFATYLFAGRALRPVEAIRAQVADLDERDLDRRVPVPAARDEVGRLAETMNAMLARLQDAQQVQRRFVADASHELRSPLATVAAGLELIRPAPDDAATVATLRAETERVNRLVDDLLLLARADERGLRPRRDEIDLDELAEAEQGRPGREVPVAVRTVPARVTGDRGQLVRVLRNLVDNATRHARSQVTVTITTDGPDAVLEVADNGPGVPADQRDRVFERFVRLDDARARTDGGAGLGLAIVAEVVIAHGGTVVATEAPGGGALFRVWIPLADPAEPTTVEAPTPAPAAPAPAARVVAVDPRPGPIRDVDARQDPPTAPYGSPVVGPRP